MRRPARRPPSWAIIGPPRPSWPSLPPAASGWQALFGDRFRPVLAPPWNRIGPQLRARLGEAGLNILSGFGARDAAPGPAQLNTHADPIDWRGGRGFAGIDRALAPILRHLADRRNGIADPEEPTGLLTHHLAHDDEGWIFLDGLLTPAGPASGRGLAGPRQPVRSPDMTAHRYDMAELGGDYRARRGRRWR